MVKIAVSNPYIQSQTRMSTKVLVVQLIADLIKISADFEPFYTPYPLKERRLKERAAPYWLRIRFIMKAPLKERSPEGTPQNQLLYGKL